ncbi:hypothetical protein IBT47_05305 [Erwinia sp. S43]|uniref:phage head spike fiber domain-containing protein n=1 Tax=Erwinia sp. S43 TaxID=2769339 RepID=UPI00190BCF1D|nr:hypothetical protein [Erwinia sp. S43]MBK0031697.1 hypothetical protein [Erwinia sp. S43]
MAITLISNQTFKGDISSLPTPSAPMPANAVIYADFINGLFIDTLNGQVNRTTDLTTRVDAARSTPANFIDESGVLTEASANVGIIDRHPHTLKKLGMRVERASINYLTAPLDFTQAAWAKTGINAALNAGYWYILTESAASSGHFIRDTTTTLTTSDANVISVYIKPGTATTVQLAVSAGGADCYANFDVANGVLLKMGGGVATANIEPGFDGSWRCSLALNSPSAAVGDIRIGFISSNSDAMTPSYPGTGRTLMAAVAQAERSFVAPTSPVTVAVKSRSADRNTLLPDIPIASRQDFSLFISGILPGSPRGDLSGNNLVTLYNETANEYICLGQGWRNGGYPYSPVATHNIGGGGAVGITGSGYGQYRAWGLMLTVKAGVVKVICTGDEYRVQTLISSATKGFERILLGRGLTGSTPTPAGHWGGFISKLAFFDKALSDTEMVSQFSALS